MRAVIAAVALALAACSGGGSGLVRGDTAIDEFPADGVVYLSDRSDTVTALVDADGRVATREAFHAYGATRGSEGGRDAYGFAGNERDATGLADFGARAYDPRARAFLAVDPHGLFPGDDATRGALRAYAYANGNPAAWSDPTGNEPKRLPLGYGAPIAAEAGVIQGDPDRYDKWYQDTHPVLLDRFQHSGPQLVAGKPPAPQPKQKYRIEFRVRVEGRVAAILGKQGKFDYGFTWDNGEMKDFIEYEVGTIAGEGSSVFVGPVIRIAPDTPLEENKVGVRANLGPLRTDGVKFSLTGGEGFVGMFSARSDSHGRWTIEVGGGPGAGAATELGGAYIKHTPYVGHVPTSRRKR